MSYILDALKHSDNERQKGTIPDLRSQPIIYHRPIKRGGRIWVYCFMFTALLLYGGYILFWPEASGTTQAVVAEKKSDESINKLTVTALSSDSIPSDSVPSDVVSSTVTDVSVEQEEVVPAIVLEQQNKPLTISKESLKELSGVKLITSSVPKAPALPAERKSSLTPPKQAKKIAIKPANPPQNLNRVAKNPPQNVALVETAALATTKDPYEGIRHFKQLSNDIKREIPELTFSVHIYSDTPSARMVKINNKTVREGGMIDRNLKLEEITRDGVIMVYRGEKFWLAKQ